MGSVPEGSGWDPLEDPGGAPLHETNPDEAWISGEALSEILAFELELKRRHTSCPRCGSWRFAYGRMQFCSRGCAENLLVVETE